MYGPKYVWILQGDYQEDWWKVNSTAVKCTAAQMLKALDGYFSTDVLEISTSREPTISTMVNTQLQLSRDDVWYVTVF